VRKQAILSPKEVKRAIITGESEVYMDEHRTHRRRFEDKIPEDVREHARAAREEMRESMKSFLPPEFWEHSKKARKEMLLAWRSMIDSALERMDKKEEKI
jgi:hypothetical protein